METAFEIFKWVGYFVCLACLLVLGLGSIGWAWQWMLKHFSPRQMYRASLILVGLHYHEKKNGMKNVSGYNLGMMCRRFKKVADPFEWGVFLDEVNKVDEPESKDS